MSGRRQLVIRTHFLKVNHQVEVPTRIVCVDTEAWTQKYRTNEDEVIHRLRLGHAVYLRYQNNRGQDKWYSQEFAFKTTKEFHDWLDVVVAKQKKVGILVVAHNMKYDFPMLDMDNFVGRPGWETPELFVLEPFICVVKNKELNVRLDIISTTNWYPGTPLKKLAKLYGSFKLTSPNWKDADTKVSDETLARYCRQDTLALAEIVKGHIDYIERNDLGKLKPTIAGQAMQAFRHRFMEHQLLVHHHDKLIQLECEAFRGGRTEAFKLGVVSEVYVHDVNSLYPGVMRDNMFPSKPSSIGLVLAGKEIDPSLWRNNCTIARCQIDLKLPCIGVKRNDTLLFPIGHIQATLTSPEMEYLYTHPEAGSIHHIGVCGLYEKAPIFKAYMEHFIALKESSVDGSIEREMAKGFMNKLFGKFGQKLYPENIPVMPDDVIEDILGGAVTGQMLIDDMEGDNDCIVDGDDYTYHLMGDMLWKVAKHHSAFAVAENSMPRIPAFVTGYARMLIWEYMMTAGLSEVYYCDTDSLITSKAGHDRLEAAGLIHPTETGKLKMVEGQKIMSGPNKGRPIWSNPTTLEVINPKFYRLGREWKRKGVSKKAKRVKGEDLSWNQEQFLSGKSRYRMGVTDGVPVRTVKKVYTRNYKKGLVGKDKVISPKVLKEW